LEKETSVTLTKSFGEANKNAITKYTNTLINTEVSTVVPTVLITAGDRHSEISVNRDKTSKYGAGNIHPIYCFLFKGGLFIKE